MKQFLLILGPSGVGKSTLIHRLCALDDRFVYIKPYVTRPLRQQETNKISVSDQELDQYISAGRILVTNSIFGYRYATPRDPIFSALAAGQFPILDWLIEYLAPLEHALNDTPFKVYLEPPDELTLRRHLDDGRGDLEKRFSTAQEELSRLHAGQYAGHIDVQLVNVEGELNTIATTVYQQFLKAQESSTA